MLVHERRERELTQLLFQIGGGMQGEEEVRVNEYKYVHRRYTQTYTQSLYSGSIALQLLILLLLLPSLRYMHRTHTTTTTRTIITHTRNRQVRFIAHIVCTVIRVREV